MRGVAEQAIFVIIVGIILVMGFIWAIMTNFAGIQDAVRQYIGTARRALVEFTGEKCAGLPTACSRWVYDGLGLYLGYDEANVYSAASNCQVLESVCPSFSGSRIGVKDCLSMCIAILDCDAKGQGQTDITTCYTDVLTKYQGGS
jgi:type II secretory pathway pseudopilin PulG